MDVYGKQPISDAGAYLRSDMWDWHPLWDMVEDLFPELASQVQYGHTNDGDGLDARNSVALGRGLAEAAHDGRCSRWIAERNAAVADLPMEDCELCEGTGIRKDEAGRPLAHKRIRLWQATVLGRRFGWCNGCEGMGWKAPFASLYRTSVQSAKEFSDFLLVCGGFEIR
jgi:hypothetical protein